jgi:hypothetical protein
MGGGLKGVSPRALAVLLVMAANAMDTPTERAPEDCYFRGWDHLAKVLGYENAKPGTAGHRAVARAVKELIGDGLIVPDVAPLPGLKNAVYRLHL